MPSPTNIIGIQSETCWVGTYALHIAISEPITIPIGRLHRGRPIYFPAGHYLYVGSALGAANSLALPRRLVRHAARSAGQQPHPVYLALLDHFAAEGLDASHLPLRAGKRLHWNIDHLLDHTAATLVQVFYIRSPHPLERVLVAHLEQDVETGIVAAGFGAQDHRGHTHLFAIPAGDAWLERWHRTVVTLAAMRLSEHSLSETD